MKPACVILAGGRGSRIGGRNKALLRTGTETFLGRIASTCRQSGVTEIAVVVAAPHLAETVQEAQGLGLAWHENKEPSLGMASSVALGFARALETVAADYCWIWPVDTPGVAVETLQALVGCAAEAQILIPSYLGRGGHPSLVHRSVWAELAECTMAPHGARSVFRRDAERVLRVDVSDAAVCMDVDRAQDLERLP